MIDLQTEAKLKELRFPLDRVPAFCQRVALPGIVRILNGRPEFSAVKGHRKLWAHTLPAAIV